MGIGLGLLVSLWCLSGFVMLYVQYPQWGPMRQLRGMPDVDFGGCCRAPNVEAAGGSFDRAVVEMHGDTPVAIVRDAYGRRTVMDLISGATLERLSRADAEEVSRTFADSLGLGGGVHWVGTVDRDQWTVSAALDRDRPLLQFAAGDRAKTSWYVSSSSGEVVQVTNARQRFWNWIGSVVHWLYPTILRRHASAWAATVVWSSLLAGFSTLLGLYIGSSRFRRRRNGRLSPYSGWALWHHYCGLLFGVLLASWLVSGAFSMTPWRFLQSRSFAAESDALQGEFLAAERLTRMLARLPDRHWPPGTVRLEASVGNGEPYWLAWNARGESIRFDAERDTQAPIGDSFFEQAATRLRPSVTVRSQGWIGHADEYYFDHHDRKRFPAYRIIFADGERFYLDASSGRLQLAVDRSWKNYRWLFGALHRGDFAAAVRRRPLWDVVMLTLLSGVTASAVTGTWLGARRLLRALSREA
jgi:hypothetical protein